MLSARLSLRLALLLAWSGVVAAPTQAQISIKATPYSFRTNLVEEVSTYTLSAEHLRLSSQQRFQQDENGFFIVPPDQHGVETPVDLGFDNAGLWTSLPNGGRLWQLRITSAGATSLNLIYDEFWMPPGAQLFLYNDDRSVVLGAFTEQNNKSYGGFATDILPGETAILEYYEPTGVAESARLHVSTVVSGLLDGVDQAATASGPYVPKALSCSINVACPAGQGWEDEAAATVKVVNGSGSCSGVLLNNTQEDGTPYVLTANHCGYPTVGQEVNWVFQFNYQSATCADPAEDPVPSSITGATVVASEIGSADYALLQLSESIPASYNVVYAGWSIESTPPSQGISIGHPKGDIKKIVIDNNQLTTHEFKSWKATFDQGTIESSSSGSPLFDENHYVVGVLRSAQTLDANACSGPGGDDNAATVIFPKLSYNWDRGNAGERISDFLDPLNTGVTSLPSSSGSSGGGDPPPPPTAEFWLNEIDSNTRNGGATEDEEFVEIVGTSGESLGGFDLDIYSCANGSATLVSSQTLQPFTLQEDYGNYGVLVLGGPGLDAAVRDQSFSGSGTDVLPDGSGLLVLKDGDGTEVFDYQYDSAADCPPGRTTRSAGDAPSDLTMGFVTSSKPSASELGLTPLTASPGEQNADGGQLLPVELTSFEAVLDGQAVELRWETASETNNAGFEVQLLEKAKPKVQEWQALGFVDGYGTTLDAQTYHYRVEDLASGRYRFRLKQIDFDGAFEYSPEVEVAIKLPKTHHVSKAYPNPFNPLTQLSISVARAQWVDVAIYDMLGRRVASLFEGQMDAQTSQAFVFEATSLPSGVYLVRVAGEQFVESQTITLLK